MNTPYDTAGNMLRKYGHDMALAHATSYALNHRFDAIDRGEPYPNAGEAYWRQVAEHLNRGW